MKTNLLALAVTVTSLVSSAAFADDWNHQTRPVQAAAFGQRDGYALQTSQVWVPGSYQQVDQAPVCHLQGWGQFQSQVCVGGGSVARWVPGHFENQQSWVWVGYPHREVYGRHGDRDEGRHRRF